MDSSQTGQVVSSAAQIYDDFFVPALFGEWADRTVAAALVEAGHSVLDVATGTGVVARAAGQRVGPNGRVTGLDINEGMLAVARQKAGADPRMHWQHGAAESLPFEDNTFDAVLSQFGLMFFVDRTKALTEMTRVLKPGGRLAVTVWDELDNTPGYATMVELLDRLFGTTAGNGLRAPYNLGNLSDLKAAFTAADLPDITISTLPGTARFSSIEAWVFTDIKGWVLADQLDETQYKQLLEEAEVALQPYVAPDGSASFRAPAHIVTITNNRVQCLRT